MLRNNIDSYIDDLIENTKGDYITHTVTYNKNNPEHLALLKIALESSRNLSAYYRNLVKMSLNSDNSQGYTVNIPKQETKKLPEKTHEKVIPQIPKEPIKLTFKENTPKDQAVETPPDSSNDIGNFFM